MFQANKVISVYIAGQVLKKLLATFPNGVDGQQALAEKKAELIYSALEAHPEAYKIVPAKSARSKMNICFRVTKVGQVFFGASCSFVEKWANMSFQGGNVDEAEKAFLKESTAINLTGLKGHRSVGGIRASNYNSIPLEGAEKLANFIHEFAKA